MGKGFNQVIYLSMFIGLVGMLSGLTSSFYLDTPPGATITLVYIAIFLVANVVRILVIQAKRK